MLKYNIEQVNLQKDVASLILNGLNCKTSKEVFFKRSISSRKSNFQYIRLIIDTLMYRDIEIIWSNLI